MSHNPQRPATRSTGSGPHAFVSEVIGAPHAPNPSQTGRSPKAQTAPSSHLGAVTTRDRSTLKGGPVVAALTSVRPPVGVAQQELPLSLSASPAAAAARILNGPAPIRLFAGRPLDPDVVTHVRDRLRSSRGPGQEGGTTDKAGPPPRVARRSPRYLANNSSSLPPPPSSPERLHEASQAQEYRRDRYALRSGVLWRESSLDRVKACGKHSVTPDGRVALRGPQHSDGNGKAGFAGLPSCGSVWSCPVCSVTILARRAQELTEALAVIRAMGGTVALVTLTLRHSAGHRLRWSWEALTYAWEQVTSGRFWVGETHKEYEKRLTTWETGPRGRRAGKPRPVRRIGMAERLGLAGFVRAVEVTQGQEHGWHPHIHAALCFDGPVSEETVTEFAHAMWATWERALKRRKYSALRDHGGLDVRVLQPGDESVISDYLTKGLAGEATLGPLKKARRENRTPFQLIQTFQQTGDLDDLDLWHEWEQASRGRKQLTWSQGLRDLAGLGKEQEDEEIVEEDQEGDDLLYLDRDGWAAIRHQAAELLDATEDHGLTGACAWLTARGVTYELPSLTPRPLPSTARSKNVLAVTQ